MKAYSILAVVVVMSLVASCNKDHMSPYGNNNGNPPMRKVHFELYTREDFSVDLHNIQFSLHMGSSGNSIFDSSLATMKVKDIPDSIHRIIVEKWVPGNDTSTLAVGFLYTIEGVGTSWYLEAFPAGDTLKVVKYPFQ